MSTKHCAYASCNSDNSHPKDRVFFIPFPKPDTDLEKCEEWLKACNCSNISLNMITKNTYVCSKHFVGGNGPTSEHPDPIQWVASKIKVRRSNKSNYTVPNIIKRRRITVPEELDHEYALLPLEIDESPELSKGSPEAPDPLVDEDSSVPESNPSDAFEADDVQDIKIKTEIQEPSPSPKCDQECQANPYSQDATTETCMEVEGIYIKKLQAEIAALREKSEKNRFNYDELRRNAKAFAYYTGFTYPQFDALWSFLNPEVSKLQVWRGKYSPMEFRNKHYKQKLPPKDQLVLCLMRLRWGFYLEDLSFRTSLSESYISKMIVTWIQFLHAKFKDLDIFPSREVSKERGMPECFQKFQNLRVILDVMGVNIQKLHDCRKQGNLYEADNTHKFLIGIVPSGGICFVSGVFPGTISDRELFQQSEIMELLEEGDAVMADRGFNVRDICSTKKCSLFIPPLLMDRKTMPPDEAFFLRDIAATKIHVEKAIGWMKEYRLLQKTLPITLLSIIPQIVFVIAMLVNFQQGYIT